MLPLVVVVAHHDFQQVMLNTIPSHSDQAAEVVLAEISARWVQEHQVVLDQVEAEQRWDERASFGHLIDEPTGRVFQVRNSIHATSAPLRRIRIGDGS